MQGLACARAHRRDPDPNEARRAVLHTAARGPISGRPSMAATPSKTIVPSESSAQADTPRQLIGGAGVKEDGASHSTPTTGRGATDHLCTKLPSDDKQNTLTVLLTQCMFRNNDRPASKYVAKFSPDLAEVGPQCVVSKEMLAEVVRVRPEVGRSRDKFDQARGNVGRCRAKLGRVLTRCPENVGRNSPKFGRSRTNVAV